MPKTSKELEKDSIRLNIAFFFIGFFVASVLLFEKYIGWNFSENIFTFIIGIIYLFGYGFGSLILLIYITLRSLHYRYRDKDKFGSRDQFKVSAFNQEVLYDIGVDSIISSLFLTITLIIIRGLGELFSLFIFK